MGGPWARIMDDPHPALSRWRLVATTGALRVVGVRCGAMPGPPMPRGMRHGLNVGDSRKIKRNENYFGALTFGVLTANEVLQYPNFAGSSSRLIGRLSVESPSSILRRGSLSRRTIQSPP